MQVAQPWRLRRQGRWEGGESGGAGARRQVGISYLRGISKAAIQAPAYG